MRLLAALSVTLPAMPAAAMSLLGSEATVAYRYPDMATPYGEASPALAFRIGAGQDAMVAVEGVTFLGVDFTANRLTVDFTTVLDNPTWNRVPFNGLVFTGLDRVRSVSLTGGTRLTGFGADRVIFDAGVLGVNWNGLTYRSGDRVELALGTVPEPASWVMLISGFGLIGGALRRQRIAVAA